MANTKEEAEQSKYDRLLGVVMDLSRRRSKLLPKQRELLEAFESAKPYQECYEMLDALLGKAAQ
jgi:hypothetical protein